MNAGAGTLVGAGVPSVLIGRQWLKNRRLAVDIVSGWGTIESRSIIPHSPTPHSRLPTPHYSGVTGIDMICRRVF